jgi:hypothetical protein
MFVVALISSSNLLTCASVTKSPRPPFFVKSGVLAAGDGHRRHQCTPTGVHKNSCRQCTGIIVAGHSRDCVMFEEP